LTDFNKDNEFLRYIEDGKDVPNAVKPKKFVDIKKALRTKYPGVPIPTGRAIRTVSDKQCRAIKIQGV